MTEALVEVKGLRLVNYARPQNGGGWILGYASFVVADTVAIADAPILAWPDTGGWLIGAPGGRKWGVAFSRAGSLRLQRAVQPLAATMSGDPTWPARRLAEIRAGASAPCEMPPAWPGPGTDAEPPSATDPADTSPNQ